MLDFLTITEAKNKYGVLEIKPDFMVGDYEDIMVRGGKFYAVWDETNQVWSTNPNVALALIDRDLYLYGEKKKAETSEPIRVYYIRKVSNKLLTLWDNFISHTNENSFHPLDEKIIFLNDEAKKSDYASKRLPYPLEKGNYDRYEELISTLYSPSERKKIEWRIGSIITGDSKKNQKFIVFYGAQGTGKSTVMNIIQDLFQGYYAVFDAKALGSTNAQFRLEPLAAAGNPLVAIQHDGDLSKIEDNTRLNSIVSHELMSVNTKNKSIYSQRFNCFLFMGTNRPVKITDAKSGILRRLIDVSPTGNKLPMSRYKELVKQIAFELGPIAYHCREVYLEDPSLYDDYVPIGMMGASNDFYNFVLDYYDIFKAEDGTTLKSRWENYKKYCDEAKVPYPLSQRLFKEELKNYFSVFEERRRVDGDVRVRNYYSGFKRDKFGYEIGAETKPIEEDVSWIQLKSQPSIFDDICRTCPAQYAKEDGTPEKAWDDISSTLSELDTSKLHYVRVPENHIVIDFDIPDENGDKSLELNLKAARNWPKTYAEVSKSGKGLHLHYIYSGDVSKLSRVYDDHIEIKVFSGKSSLRRKLSRCNDLDISTITSNLPLKEVKKVVDFERVKSERALRNRIIKNLQKEYHPNTKPSVDFIFKILEDRYRSDLRYDVSDLYPSVLAFASKSTNNRKYCMELVGKMKFASKLPPENKKRSKWSELVFYDVEVFVNLFVVCWKKYGRNAPVMKMKNPTKEEIEGLLNYKLAGFNNRRYDNHILYARLLGFNNRQLYLQSQRIINNDRGAFFGRAYNISYTDIYDFSSKKQSLKKFEIELGIHHQELGFPWDQPVPEDKWDLVAEYCANDVIATEAVWEARQADFTAREILADVAGLTVNDTTNTLTTKIIFGENRKPQDQFNYRDMGDMSNAYSYVDYTPGGTKRTFALHIDDIPEDQYTVFDKDGKPIFPGYTYSFGKSIYRGEEVGEGGYVYAEPGIHRNVALLDIRSMHPSSIVAENLFGDTYTQRFKDILDGRIAIKHKDFDTARGMLNGALTRYLEDENQAKELSGALKIAINSVYGLTSARFENPFKDPRNVDNIVAKRGALFMVNLKHEVQKRGFTVAHIKTDSIKIPDATPEIISFVMDYGKMYGYTFEHEATYEKMCLVNDAVYIAKYKDGDWTATGTQFQVPYVFKTLFSHEPIIFSDMCETKSVQSRIYLDLNENLPEGEHDYRYIGKVGSFCPVKKGSGGGVLYREQNGKYYSVTGTKGYRWLEAEQVKSIGSWDMIDKTYYTKLVDEAVQTISKYGSFDEFI